MTPTVVLDASTTLAWAFDDEPSSYVDGVLNFVTEHCAIVPPLWNYEVANAVTVGIRRLRLSADDALAFAEDLSMMDIRVESSASDVLPLLAEAMDTGLTAYDAAYVMLARTQSLPLATLDRAMIRAAKKLGVDIF